MICSPYNYWQTYMIYTEFDPLEEVIVGDTFQPGDLDSVLPAGSRDGVNRILEESKQDLDHFSDLLARGGVKVHRPRVQVPNRGIKMPGLSSTVPSGPVNPRDQYKVQGKTIIQTYTSIQDRYFDSLCYYEIFYDLFKQGYNWISQPIPLLQQVEHHEHWIMNESIYRKPKIANNILWHTATMLSAGDKIIVNSFGPGTDAGFDWIRKNLPEFTFVSNKGAVYGNNGHIDTGFVLIDDETVLHSGIDWVPKVLRNKRCIDLSRYISDPSMEPYLAEFRKVTGRYDPAWIQHYLNNRDRYNQYFSFDLNVLILDSKNIVFERENLEMFRYLKTFGIDCWVANQRHRVFWEGGVHCMTLDIKRRGQCRTIIDSSTDSFAELVCP